MTFMAPFEMEVVKRHALVSQCVVIGDRKPFIAAIESFAWLPVGGGQHAKCHAAQGDGHISQRLNQVIGLYLDLLFARLPPDAQGVARLHHFSGQRFAVDGQPQAANRFVFDATSGTTARLPMCGWWFPILSVLAAAIPAWCCVKWPKPAAAPELVLS